MVTRSARVDAFCVHALFTHKRHLFPALHRARFARLPLALTALLFSAPRRHCTQRRYRTAFRFYPHFSRLPPRALPAARTHAAKATLLTPAAPAHTATACTRGPACCTRIVTSLYICPFLRAPRTTARTTFCAHCICCTAALHCAARRLRRDGYRGTSIVPFIGSNDMDVNGTAGFGRTGSGRAWKMCFRHSRTWWWLHRRKIRVSRFNWRALYNV